MPSRFSSPSMLHSGGERGPVISPAFKAGDSVLSGSNGGFDSHTLPPIIGLKIDCVNDFNSDRESSGLLSQRLRAPISRPRSTRRQPSSSQKRNGSERAP